MPPLSRKILDHYETLIFAADSEETPTIDLHGFDASGALHELDLFIYQQLYRRTNVVRIIHGKGQGRLKTEVHRWLREHPAQIAYAREPFDGRQDGLTFVVLHV